MRKIILFVALLLGIYPSIDRGNVKLSSTISFAQSQGQENGWDDDWYDDDDYDDDDGSYTDEYGDTWTPDGDGGYYNQWGDYTDEDGNYYYYDGYGWEDPWGGYTDPDGGYYDPYGGYETPDGGYWDPEGGYTTPDGYYYEDGEVPQWPWMGDGYWQNNGDAWYQDGNVYRHVNPDGSYDEYNGDGPPTHVLEHDNPWYNDDSGNGGAGSGSDNTIPSDGWYIDIDNGDVYYNGQPWVNQDPDNSGGDTDPNDMFDDYETPNGYDTWEDFWNTYYDTYGDPTYQPPSGINDCGCPVLKSKSTATVLTGSTDPCWCKVSSSLTSAEQAIVNELEEEDSTTDNLINNQPDCYGTSRNGNVRWPGTAEHWLIQFDYAATHQGGLREYSIPGAGNSGGRGYADIANPITGEMFEIKPDNPAGRQAGAAEVEMYINAANISCPGPNGPWRKGTGYTQRTLPHPTDPTKVLISRLFGAGVIVYLSQGANNNPEPIPVILPESLLNRLKNFARQLAAHPENMERQIILFLKENPQIVPYLKAAAVGIVIGTIAEDILTYGGGIADDWLSFVIARNIWRVAVRL